MEEESDLISDFTDEKFVCHNCGKPVEKFSEMYLDHFLFETFAYVWCSEKCCESYINSK